MDKKFVKDIIQVQDKFYIVADSSLADEQTRILKYAETFGIFNSHGDIRPLGFENHGIFHEGTRFVSRWDVKINGKSPLLLSSNVKKDNDFLRIDLTNPDLILNNEEILPRGIIHLTRTVFLLEGSCHEQMKIFNYAQKPVFFTLSFEYQSDYLDIFEVRGIKRSQKGVFLDPFISPHETVLQYEGLDKVIRKTCFQFKPDANEAGSQEVSFFIQLMPQEEKILDIAIRCVVGNELMSEENFVQAFGRIKNHYQESWQKNSQIRTSNEQFNNWLNQSKADLVMLNTRTAHGFYPFAGIPWFSTFFGRDGIITAFEMLWIYPEIAKGVLDYLAGTQAKEVDPDKEAEPGKVIHEERKGEMAALKEIPFGRYYGSVDATPLFVVLAGHYYERTADREFITKIWPNIEAALHWMDHYGDIDRDGFIEYRQHATKGLVNQGWKDSEDSVFHADGRLANLPIALCEVQGYAYEAKKKAAMMAHVLFQDQEKSKRWNDEADLLQKKFLEKFWCEDLGTYAIALDGEKKPCKVRTSNAGHALFSGIASEDHAKRVVKDLTSDVFFTGWGIRTVASNAVRYNPMSYHNGSVWPHDNALIGYGMNRYGLKDAALKVLTGLFDASIFMDLSRLPELFCGFRQREGEGPTLYPVACDPQAWAAGAVFLLLQAVLGISIQASENRIYFTNPVLPASLKIVHIDNLHVGTSVIDISIQRYPNDVDINVKRKEGKVAIISIK